MPVTATRAGMAPMLRTRMRGFQGVGVFAQVFLDLAQLLVVFGSGRLVFLQFRLLLGGEDELLLGAALLAGLKLVDFLLGGVCAWPPVP